MMMNNSEVMMNMKSKFCLNKTKFLIFNQLFSIDGDMQTSIHSIIPDGSDKFFTIDESYCPTMQNYPINFDDITRETLWYYIENVSRDQIFEC
jgi:hypothetical protein